MRIENREQLEAYAMQICLPLMERTAKRRLKHIKPLVNDGAGYLLGFVEAFCRPLWGIAPALLQEDRWHLNVEGEKIPVCQWIRECVLDAVDAKSPYNWNRVEGMDECSYYNQMKTELAGLLVGFYFARETLWDPYTTQQKKQIADWIYQINHKAYEMVWDCNHVWFIVLCLTVLKRLGYEYDDTNRIVKDGLERMHRMYVGDGFYQDGKFGRFDYYNPWAMHTYPLLWCLIADESFENYEAHKKEFCARTEQLLKYYPYMFDANGCHVPFGRSLSYRFAASSVFPMAAAAGCQCDAGLAKEITLRNIEFFAQHTQLDSDGIFPPGFLYEAPQVVETYTSDGGAYWCSKAFLALLLPQSHAFWQSERQEIPTQKQFFVQTGHNRINMPLTGSEMSGVTLYNNTANYLQDRQKTQWFLDMAGYYSKFAYHSRSGFGLSTRDEVSSDSMITLLTPDGTMESHRYGFEDLGVQEDGRLLCSRHQPFANDANTTIETKLFILSPAAHVRVHKVILSQPYRVREGGFCVPCKTDRKSVCCKGNEVSVEADGWMSRLCVTSKTECRVFVKTVQPGMHLMAPMACYPAWETPVLEAGEYLFATVFVVGCEQTTTPSVELRDDKVVIDSKWEITW